MTLVKDHYDKVLDHARRRLHSSRSGARARAEILESYKRFIKVENRRLRMLHEAGASGLSLCGSRSRLLDVVLQNLVTDMLEHGGAEPTLGSPLTLVAVGGYGRGVLNPRSDVDLLFLTQISGIHLRSDITELIGDIVTMLFDVGFQVGHSVRSVKECVMEANVNNQTKTSLIEARLLSGDIELFDHFREEVWKHCFSKKKNEFLEHRSLDLQERHGKMENTPFVQEPNVKQGCGGLRDFQNLIWMAYIKYRRTDLHSLVEEGVIEEAEYRELMKSYDFLLRVRNQMHYIENRSSDVLTLRLQGRVAKALGYSQKGILRQIEAFMRDYYIHTRNLFRRSQDLMRRWQIQARPEKKPGLLARMKILPRRKRPAPYLEDDLTVRGGLLYPKHPGIFQQEPVRLLKVFLHAQVAGLELSPELERLIQRGFPLVNRQFRYSKAAKEVFEAILSRRGEAGVTLRRMHEVGLLGKYLPEFGAMECLVQHEFFHHFTADEHTLRCIEQLDKLLLEESTPQTALYRDLFREHADPFVLYLAFLLHDSGRASDIRPHEDASALLAMRICRRWSLPAVQRSSLLFLVNNHLLLFRYSTQKNIEDPAVLKEFVSVVKSVDNLNALMLFTCADAKGTSPTAWTSWKDMSAHRLYRMAKAYLTDPDGANKASVSPREELARLMEGKLSESYAVETKAHLTFMPEHYFSYRQVEEVTEHIRLIRKYLKEERAVESGVAPPALKWTQFEEAGATEITVASWDRARLLAKIVGILAAENLNIVSADIYRREDDLILDVIRFSDSEFRAVTSPAKIKRVENAVNRAFTDPDFKLSTLMLRSAPGKSINERTGRDIARKLDISQDQVGEFTVVSVQTPDRPGLLYEFFKTFSNLKIEVCHARVLTELGAAVDTFYVRDVAGTQVRDPEILETLRRRLFEIVAA